MNRADSELWFTNFNSMELTASEDTKVMILRIKKARLEAQVACARSQLMLVEMELRLAVKELHQELHRSEAGTPESEPPSPQPKRPRKLVKLLSKVFKPTSSSSSAEEPDSTASFQGNGAPGDGVTRNNKERTREQSKQKTRSDKAKDKENKLSRAIPQNTKSENASVDTGKKQKVHKTTDTNKMSDPETIDAGNNKSKAGKGKHTEDHKKKHRTKEHKGKSRHKSKKANSTSVNYTTGLKTKGENKNASIGKAIKSILKKPRLQEETNNNVVKSQVEHKEIVATIKDNASSNGLSKNSIVEIPKDIVFEQGTHESEAKKVLLKLVDAVDSLHNDLLFKELRDSDIKKEKSTSMTSLETLILGTEECYADM